MKRYLVRFENMKVFSVSEIGEGLLAIAGNHVVDDNLDAVQNSLNAAGIDTSEIDKFKLHNAN
jgi:hypothetical protein